MALELTKFDPAAYLETPESMAAYLEDAITDTPDEFLEALGVVARAKGMTEIARSANLARPALYRALSSSGRPEFGTVARVLRSLGLVMHVGAATALAHKSTSKSATKTKIASGSLRQAAGAEKQAMAIGRSPKAKNSIAVADPHLAGTALHRSSTKAKTIRGSRPTSRLQTKSPAG